MTNYSAASNNSRYIPFTQQTKCCVPTSLQMVMYRNNIPLIPAEELGYHLGLVVPLDGGGLFWNARVADTPPSKAGYGTQIYNAEYELNKVFKKLGIPLKVDKILASEIKNTDNLVAILSNIENNNIDALLCFNDGVISGKYEEYSGHVVVFDRIVNGEIQIVDASPKQPKWRLINPDLMLEAIKQHDNTSSGGIWILEKID